ncbi:MAG: hypothetical protein ACM31C_32815 [Acidobacteriota bacterium]
MRGVVRALALVVAAATPALADEPPPWAVGVTDAQKASAKALLDEGNARFVEHDYVAALDRYRKAIAVWDHPAIRFNVVRCLIQLDRPLDAYDELERTLKYGSKPLEEAVYAEALAYQKLLANEIGHIEVRCAQAGVHVSLDGQPLVACPGTQQRRLAPGAHQVVGTREGFLTQTIQVVVVGGKHEDVSVALQPLASVGKVVHRWSGWVPWLVVGGGVAVAGIGALIDYQASRDMTDYDRALVTACLDVGCDASHPVPASVAAQKTRAEHESELGIGVMAAGAAALATGGVLLYLNRGRTLYPASEHLGRIDVSPRPGGAFVSASGRF